MKHWENSWWMNNETKFYVHFIKNNMVHWTYDGKFINEYDGFITVDLFKNYIKDGSFIPLFKMPKNYTGVKQGGSI